MDIRTTSEDPLQIHERQDFVSSNSVDPGVRHVPAWEIQGPDNHVIGIEANTPIAPEARDANGEKLDTSTRIVMQKADPQGNPLGNAIIFDDNLGAFDYEEMRSDPRFFRMTQKSLMLDEREYLYIYLYIPNGATAFDTANSRLTIGDKVTETGKAVYIRDKTEMSGVQQQAVSQANSK